MTGSPAQLSRDEISAGVTREYAEAASLLRSLDEDDWSKPTRCEGWVVADVAAHVAGQIDDVANLRLDGLGSPEVVARQVDELGTKTAEELADIIQTAIETAGAMVAGFDDDAWEAPSPGGFGGTLGEGVHGLWYDTWVHADDIRAAIGREPDRGPGLEAAVARAIAQIERDDRASLTLVLDGMDELEVNGGGQRVEGDPYDFLMVATGRADPAILGLDESVNVYSDYA